LLHKKTYTFCLNALDTFRHFYFSKGWPELNLEILKRLSAICGPFIFIPDANSIPALVEPDTNPETVWRAWGLL
jgi:hypothetical protein